MIESLPTGTPASRRRRMRPLVRTIAMGPVTSSDQPEGELKDRLRTMLKQAEQQEAQLDRLLVEIADEEEEERLERARKKRSRKSVTIVAPTDPVHPEEIPTQLPLPATVVTHS